MILSDNYDNNARTDNRPLIEIRAVIKELQLEHAAQGRPLSGRVLHVCHYIPITCYLQDKLPLTPPRTPDANRQSSILGDSPPLTAPLKWNLRPRSGHSAMISGIRSLSEICEQVIVGWTGDLLHEGSLQPVPLATLQDEDKTRLEQAILSYQETDETRVIKLQPVWLKERLARGHYEGYCKNGQRPS